MLFPKGTVLCLAWPAFYSVIILLGVILVVGNTNFCGSVFETQPDHTLVGHNISTASAIDEFECQIKCLGIDTCRSFNVHPGAEDTKRICELNNVTRWMKPWDFTSRKGSQYYGSVKTSCVDVSHHEDKQTNRGHCHPGYKGNRCQIRASKHGLSPQKLAHSCKDIRDSEAFKGDGKYWIDPEKSGKPLQVYCDMTTDGGGWLLVSNIELQSSNPLSALPVNSSYHGISSHQMILTKTAMKELRTHLAFTQVRFHCSKQKGRTFHVTTAANSSGEAVVRYFSGQTDIQPASCGSFVRMASDNSLLSRVCERWGWENGHYNVGKWGHGRGEDRLYQYPAFRVGSYHWFVVIGSTLCDDDVNQVSTSAGDFWQVFVR